MISKNQVNIPAWQMNMIFHSTLIWRDLAIWTRLYLVSVYAGLGDQELIYNRLSRIPAEFGNSIRIFFGNDIANEYSDLLNLQVLLMKKVINAQAKRDTKAVQDNTTQLYEVADKRAALLAKVNPFWQQSQLRTLIYTFLSLFLEESTAFLLKNYDRSIYVFDRLMSHAAAIGDFASQGMYNYIMFSS